MSSAYTFEKHSKDIQTVQYTLDATSWSLFIIISIPLIYVYRYHNASELLRYLIHRKRFSGSRTEGLEKHKWLWLLLNSALFFGLYHIILHEPVILIQHIVVNTAYNRGEEPGIDEFRVVQLRRLCAYFDYMIYFGIFCLFVPIWMQSALVWMDHSQKAFSDRLRKAIKTTLVTVMILFVVALLPILSIAIYELCRPSSSPSTESERPLILFAFCGPLVAVLLISVLCLIVALGIKVLLLIRENKLEKKTDSEDNKQKYNQQQTTIKLFFAMVFLFICAATRICGVVLSLTGLPEFIGIIIYLRIPALLFISGIALTFFPFTKLSIFK